MHVALRPYVTSGVALVGAAAIAATPIAAPPDIKLPNPLVQASSDVQLAAVNFEQVVNSFALAIATASVSGAQVLTPVVAKLLDQSPAAAEAFLAVGALGLLGPVISGAGGFGAGTQDILDALGSHDPGALLNAIIGAPATLLDGLVNGGGLGPDVGPLVAAIYGGLSVTAGGLINTGLGYPISTPGLIPTVQGLVSQLFALINPPTAMAAQSVSADFVAPRPDDIERAVNALVFVGAKTAVSLAVPVAGLLGIKPTAAAGLTLGLLGPLISGPGAVGTATQDVVNSLASHDVAKVVNEVIGAPATVIDGVVNGGYGPDLSSLVTPPNTSTEYLSKVKPLPIKAGGLINPGNLNERAMLARSLAPSKGLVLPGTIPTVQTIVKTITTPRREVELEKRAAQQELVASAASDSGSTAKKGNARHRLDAHPIRDIVKKLTTRPDKKKAAAAE